MSGKRLSIVVPVRNGAGTLPALLDELTQQVDPRHTEVLIVNDGSTDETESIVARYEWCRHLRLSGRHGVPAALNIGVEATSAPLVALTDSDCIPAGDWIARGLAALARPDSTGVVAGEVRIVLDDPTLAALLDAATFLDQERYVHQGHFATANVWFTREALARAGRFDETIAWHGFDTDYGHRLTKAGLRPHYARDVVIQHPARSSLRSVVEKAIRVGRGRAQIGAPPLLSSPRSLLPARSLAGKARLAGLGADVGRFQEKRLVLAQYLVVHLPMLLAESLEARRQRATRLEGIAG